MDYDPSLWDRVLAAVDVNLDLMVAAVWRLAQALFWGCWPPFREVEGGVVGVASEVGVVVVVAVGVASEVVVLAVVAVVGVASSSAVVRSSQGAVVVVVVVVAAGLRVAHTQRDNSGL